MTTAAETAPRSLVVEQEMPHAPEVVWRALTEGPLLAEWLMDNDFQPVPGHRFTLRTAPVPQWNGIVECAVLSIEKPRRLAYSWNSAGVETVVTFTLTPTAKGVLVRMEQSGFRPGEERNLQGARYGWQRYLAALAGVVARLGASV